MFETRQETYETPSQAIVNLAAAVRELEAAGRTRSRSIGLGEAQHQARELCRAIDRIREAAWPEETTIRSRDESR